MEWGSRYEPVLPNQWCWRLRDAIWTPLHTVCLKCGGYCKFRKQMNGMQGLEVKSVTRFQYLRDHRSTVVKIQVHDSIKSVKGNTRHVGWGDWSLVYLRNYWHMSETEGVKAQSLHSRIGHPISLLMSCSWGFFSIQRFNLGWLPISTTFLIKRWWHIELNALENAASFW